MHTNLPSISRTSLCAGLTVALLSGLAGGTTAAHAATPAPIPADGETVPVTHSGDAADDPAIWVHPTDPAQSLVIGNDKGGALEVYDLAGNLVERITEPAGFWGNVDVRQNVAIPGVSDVLGVVRGGMRFYTVDPRTRRLDLITDGTGTVATYGEGFCLYQSAASQRLYAFVITRAGWLRQYEVRDADRDQQLEAAVVRNFQVGSEAEGCVADDETGQLYVSQEDVAIWRYGAEPSAGSSRTAVDTLVAAGGNLTADIEGLTLATLSNGDGYLIASAQNGASTPSSYFAVYERGPGNAYVNSFRVTDGDTGDDCDGTDGIAAYAGNLGTAYPDGLFVCQDGNNSAPGFNGNQNFKYVRLGSILDRVQGPPQPLPAAALLWGAEVQPSQENMIALETAVGRPFASTRVFLSWDSSFPDSYHRWLSDTGHTMMVSVKPDRTNGAALRWADIAAAQPGSALYAEIVGWADRMRALAVPVFFTFNHEPEAAVNAARGTSAEYIAAWRHVVDIFRDRGVDNARFTWIMTAYSFRLPSTDSRYAAKWYPGDAYVDDIASDAYNWYTCRTGVRNAWQSLEFLIDGMRQFGAAHPDKDLYLTEWGSTEDPDQPGRKAQWIADAQQLFKQPEYAQFRGVSYFNVPGQGNCTWFVTSSSSALAAFTAMADDPYYGGDGTG